MLIDVNVFLLLSACWVSGEPLTLFNRIPSLSRTCQVTARLQQGECLAGKSQAFTLTLQGLTVSTLTLTDGQEHDMHRVLPSQQVLSLRTLLGQCFAVQCKNQRGKLVQTCLETALQRP